MILEIAERHKKEGGLTAAASSFFSLLSMNRHSLCDMPGIVYKQCEYAWVIEVFVHVSPTALSTSISIHFLFTPCSSRFSFFLDSLYLLEQRQRKRIRTHTHTPDFQQPLLFYPSRLAFLSRFFIHYFWGTHTRILNKKKNTNAHRQNTIGKPIVSNSDNENLLNIYFSCWCSFIFVAIITIIFTIILLGCHFPTKWKSTCVFSKYNVFVDFFINNNT